MPSEDDRAAHFLAEGVVAVLRLEVALQQVGRHAFDLLGRVGRLPRLLQGLLVHVGRINLDTPAELFEPQGLHQQYGERVRFFAGGAARAPQADRVLRMLGVQQARHELLAHEIPDVRVPEETGNINEDRIEQQREFVWMHFEVVRVVGEVRHVHRFHALADAPLQAGALVWGEVEAARALQIVQQRFEIGVTHCWSPQGRARCPATYWLAARRHIRDRSWSWLGQCAARFPAP